MKNLKKDLKNKQWAPLYFFGGEEEYLKEYYIQEFEKAISYPAINIKKINEQFSAQEGVEFISTLPFLSERKLLICKNCDFFQSSKKKEALAFIEACKQLPEYVCVIISDIHYDRRSEVYKKLTSISRFVLFDRQKEKDLLAWIQKICKENNMEIEQSAACNIITHAKSNMLVILSQLESIMAYCNYQNTITEKEVHAFLSNDIESNVFQIVESMASGRKEEAIQNYRQLLENKESPIMILYILTKQIKQLLQAKKSNQLSMDAKKFGQKEFIWKKNKALTKNLSYEAILAAFEQAIWCDLSIKNGSIKAEDALLLLISQHFASTN